MTKEVEKSSLDSMLEGAPNNSLKAKQLEDKASKEDKAPAKQINGAASVRKQSTGAKVKDALGLGNPREVASYLALEVLIPGLKDLVVDIGKRGIDRAFYGDSAPKGSKKASKSGRASTSRISYNSMYDEEERPGYRSGGSRRHTRHDYEDIWFEDDAFGSPSKAKEAAELVLANMRDTIDQYDFCKISDLYSFAKLDSTSYLDTEWGWDRLGRADVVRVDGGFILDLPEPVRRS